MKYEDYIKSTERYINNSHVFNDVFETYSNLLKFLKIKKPILSGRIPLLMLKILENKKHDDLEIFSLIDDIDIFVEENESEKLRPINSELIKKYNKKHDVLYKEHREDKQQVHIKIDIEKYKIKKILDLFVKKDHHFLFECTSIEFDLYKKRFIRSKENLLKIQNFLEKKIRLNNINCSALKDGIYKELIALYNFIEQYDLRMDDVSFDQLKIVNDNIEKDIKKYLEFDINHHLIYKDAKRTANIHNKEMISFFLEKLKEKNLNFFRLYLKESLDFINIREKLSNIEIISENDLFEIEIKRKFYFPSHWEILKIICGDSILSLYIKERPEFFKKINEKDKKLNLEIKYVPEYCLKPIKDGDLIEIEIISGMIKISINSIDIFYQKINFNEKKIKIKKRFEKI